ncbi:hypothetical protein BT96DRAFT_660508 [Gymnopus androsaceus JB14]|uniref:Uncharacterized protein n=1 Tax=Gymnopus androsaceus JB14 TaxID=1447944 RepID=A0A6A4HQM5_9AGAR|nr:hypothetical protein BT96DRAFT_660508 [Gymnopus androsaceus JB14]
MLYEITTTKVIISDFDTMLAYAAAGGTSLFRWRDDDEPVVLASHAVFNFVVENHNENDKAIAPVWIWWSICVQAAWSIGHDTSLPPDELTKLCHAEWNNIDLYNLNTWMDQLSLPTEFLRSVEDGPSAYEYFRSVQNVDNFDVYTDFESVVKFSKYSVVPLTSFLKTNFKAIIDKKLGIEIYRPSYKSPSS